MFLTVQNIVRIGDTYNMDKRADERFKNKISRDITVMMQKDDVTGISMHDKDIQFTTYQ